ncbi:hypothetical protein FRB99_008180 [Tulasnella sp. 403]|nr:hypothetical protein FRB99_008180 [Tulasnella sp. 403]
MAHLVCHLAKRKPQTTKVVWASLEKLIVLANAAQIPLCGGAFGVAKELIDMFNSADDNRKACHDLLRLTAQYGETVWQFVQALSPDYIKDSTDRQAEVARTAIRHFGSELDSVKRVVYMQTLKGKIARFILSSGLRDDVEECKQRLVAAHQAFKDAVLNIVVANTHETNGAVSRTQDATVPPDRFKIMGARPLSCHDVEIVGNVEDSRTTGSFWTKMVTVRVRDKTFVAKVYSDMEDRFVRDLKRLARVQRIHLPRVYGHCHESETPFIVLYGETFIPVMTYPESFFKKSRLDGGTCICSSWKMLLDLRDAAQFLVENSIKMSPREARKIFQDAKIDDTGDIIIAPLDSESMEAAPSDEPSITGFLGIGSTYWGLIFLDTSRQPIRQAMRSWIIALGEAYRNSTYSHPIQAVLQLKTDNSPSDTSVVVFDSAPVNPPQDTSNTECKAQSEDHIVTHWTVQPPIHNHDTNVNSSNCGAVEIPSQPNAMAHADPHRDGLCACVTLTRGEMARQAVSYYRRRYLHSSECFWDRPIAYVPRLR